MDLAKGVVRIRNAGGDTVGTGFLISSETIVTCTHVLEAALGRPLASSMFQSVNIAFVFQTDPHRIVREAALLSVQEFTARTASDIALLRLSPGQAVPEPVQSLAIGSRNLLDQQDCVRTFGYPSIAPIDGFPGSLKFLNDHPQNGRETLIFESDTVGSGMSGAPVWHPDFGVVIGMVRSLPNLAEEAGTPHFARVCYVTPIDLIRELFPQFAASKENPYRELKAFEIADRDLFFGREEESAQLIAILNQHGLAVVTGASGSGKSSLVRAGLSRALTECHQELALHQIAACNVGPHPFLNLLLALSTLHGAAKIASAFGISAEAFENSAQNDGRVKDAMTQYSKQLPADLGARFGTFAREQHTILVFDQFERLYHDVSETATRDRFLAMLQAARKVGAWVVVALRREYFENLVEPFELRGTENERVLTLGKISPDKLMEIIQKPAAAMAVVVEQGLVQRLVAEAADEVGSLPLLEFALHEIWEHDHEKGLLTEHTLDELGYRIPGKKVSGLRGVILRRAESIFNRLSGDAQQRFKFIFAKLLAPGREGVIDVSRRALLSEFDPAEARLVRYLFDSFLLTSGRDALTREDTAEVSHEALSREWDRVQGWLREYEGFVTAYHECVGEDFRKWLAGGKKSGQLLRADALRTATALRARYPDLLDDHLGEFIRKSQRRGRRHWLIGIGAGVTLLSIVAVVAFAWQRDWDRIRKEMAQEKRSAAEREEQNQKDAKEQQKRQIALQKEQEETLKKYKSADYAREATARVLSPILADRTGVAFLLALEAKRIASTPQADDALRAVLQYSPYLAAFLSADLDAPVDNLVMDDRGRWLAAIYDAHPKPILGMWDLEKRQFMRLRDGVHDVAIDPSGNYILYAADDALWIAHAADWKAARQLRSLDWTPGGITISGDGRYLALTKKNSVLLWALGNLEGTTSLSGDPKMFEHTGEVLSLALDSGAQYLAAGGGDDDKKISVWNVKTMQRFGEPLQGHRGQVLRLKFVTDSKRSLSAAANSLLSVSGADAGVFCWDFSASNAKERLCGKISAGQGPTMAVAVRGTEGRFGFVTASAGWFGRVALDGDSPVKVLLKQDSHIWALTMARHRPLIAAGTQNGQIVLWDLSSALILDHAVSFMAQPGAKSIVAAGPHATSVRSDANPSEKPETESGLVLTQWELDSQPRRHLRHILPEGGHPVALVDDGSTLACLQKNGLLSFVNIETGAPVVRGQPLGIEGAPISAVCFAPGKSDSVAIAARKRMVYWAGNNKREQELPSNVLALAISSHAPPLIAAACDEGELVIFDSEPWAQRSSSDPGFGQVLSVAFSPDRRMAAVGCHRESVAVWDLEKQSWRAFSDHQGPVRAVAFSADSRFLASGDQLGNIIVRDLKDGRIHGIPLEVEGRVRGLAFADADRVLLVAADNSIVRFRLGIDDYEKRIESIVNRNFSHSEWESFFPGSPYRKTFENLPIPKR